jgi:hypothetical protein
VILFINGQGTLLSTVNETDTAAPGDAAAGPYLAALSGVVTITPTGSDSTTNPPTCATGFDFRVAAVVTEALNSP